MATQAIPGFDGEIYISIDGGTTYRKVGEAREITLEIASDPIDATSHDSAGWRETIAGLNSWTASCESLYIGSNQGQDDVYSALTAKTVAKWKFIPRNSSGLEKWSGDGTITRWSLSNPNEDASTIALDIQGSGSISKGSV